MNRLTVLDEHSHAGIYAGPCTGMSERTLRLPYNCVVHIGRSQKNDVEIHNPFISGNHMLIRSESGVIRVEDQDSTNGTYLNGKKDQPGTFAFRRCDSGHECAHPPD